MFTRSSPLKSLRNPQKSLVAIFVLWKSVLLLIAVCSPGPGYDTSTTLAQPYDDLADQSSAVSLLRLFSTKLTRWDAIYFTTVAKRDYLYEQEWAFGWGFTRLIKFFANGIGFLNYEFLESFIGICLAHAAHGLSVLALYHLTLAVHHDSGTDKKLAFVSACIHIFSPAGLFLSAPFAESTFSFLSFLGYFLFVKSFKFQGQTEPLHDILIITSGVVLGCATSVRSNGILNGLLFLEELIRTLYTFKDGLRLPSVRRMVATGIGGLCTAIGFFVPQFIAFQEFCGNQIPDDHSKRAWCKYTIPSIYSYVQSYYWNVGFLRYWTLSNIPLFILALPMLGIMMISSLAVLWNSGTLASERQAPTTSPPLKTERRLLRSLAIPQLTLAVLTLTSYHVQIINRLCSGYCVWYFWLAHSVIVSAQDNPKPKTDKAVRRILKKSSGFIIYIIVYAAVQGVLFSSFLPPA